MWYGDDFEQRTLSPLSYLKEQESKWVLEFDLPLVDKKDISVYINEEGMIVVEAKLRETYYDPKVGSRYKFEYFKKISSLPKNIDTKKIIARFDEGRLVITMPKLFRGTPIKIE
jgi:HSP20 family protein